MTKTRNQGFTLIELLVVIAIIGLLSTIIVASLSTVRKKARDTKRVADVKSIQLGLEMFFDSNRTYPSSTSQLSTGGYMPSVPVDPTSNAAYSYTGWGSGATCTGYHLGATLEDSTNQALSSDSDNAGTATVCTSGGSNFAGTDPVYDIVN